MPSNFLCLSCNENKLVYPQKICTRCKSYCLKKFINPLFENELSWSIVTHDVDKIIENLLAFKNPLM